jgi:hypothetical protein
MKKKEQAFNVIEMENRLNIYQKQSHFYNVSVSESANEMKSGTGYYQVRSKTVKRPSLAKTCIYFASQGRARK